MSEGQGRREGQSCRNVVRSDVTPQFVPLVGPIASIVMISRRQSYPDGEGIMLGLVDLGLAIDAAAQITGVALVIAGLVRKPDDQAPQAWLMPQLGPGSGGMMLSGAF